MRSLQAPEAVVMIRPHHFTPNAQTAEDNSFQSTLNGCASAVAKQAYDEISEAVKVLRSFGVSVHLFEDESKATPDSVFPNNWFSTHAGGHVALHAMYSKNRRAERRMDVMELLKQRFRVQDLIDYSGLEQDGLFLEGTGAMVIDHLERVVYAARSNRMSDILLERFCTHFNYEPLVFDAVTADGNPIYHTNVLMCIGTDFALIGTDMISDAARRAVVIERLAHGERDVIALSTEQIGEFAGNAIELQGADGRLLAISARAVAALTPDQVARIERHATLVALEIPTIELAGGSVRCTIAGLHLSARPLEVAA
ncbi:MAG: citrulline utilization hydrolase CtlX [Pelagimonas sp.]|uniref:citrulline utilization hydrolase CtlX n=1 Tax=Pelagimonas sp. TaxID=2073170 RepID=UPI003D6C4316